MLDFQKIENGINTFLRYFLKNILGKIEVNLDALDTSSLIEYYINNFNEISEKNNYDDKELYNRAWLLKISRNKYYHIKGNSKFDAIVELADILNIYLFVKSMEPNFIDETDYFEFISYLKYKVFNIFNTSKDSYIKNKQKTDNDNIDTQKMILDIYNTVVKTVPENNQILKTISPDNTGQGIQQDSTDNLENIKPKVVSVKLNLKKLKPKVELIKQNILELENNQNRENQYLERRKIIVIKKKTKE